MMRKIFGAVCVVLGTVLVLVALGVACLNLWREERAGVQVNHAMVQLLEQMPPATVPATPDVPTLYPQAPSVPQEPIYQAMPEVVIDGIPYIGYLNIPALKLELPVIGESSEDNLEIAPCRFYGTVYNKNFVIGGHRYRRHFRKLSTLGYGEYLNFTDIDGNVYVYEVVECEVIEPYEAEYLCSGDWDLSLYTCTPGGLTRVVLRCLRVNV